MAGEQEEKKVGGYGMTVVGTKKWCYTTGEGVVWMIIETIPDSEWSIVSHDPREDNELDPPIYSWDFDNYEEAQFVFDANMRFYDGLLTEDELAEVMKTAFEGGAEATSGAEKMKAVLEQKGRIA